MSFSHPLTPSDRAFDRMSSLATMLYSPEHPLQTLFSPAYGTYLRLAEVARSHMRQQGLSYDRRDDFFGDYYASEVLFQLEQDNLTAAVASTAELLERYNVTVPIPTLSAAMKETG